MGISPLAAIERSALMAAISEKSIRTAERP
jgi:hypothetical protein